MLRSPSLCSSNAFDSCQQQVLTFLRSKHAEEELRTFHTFAGETSDQLNQRPRRQQDMNEDEQRDEISYQTTCCLDAAEVLVYKKQPLKVTLLNAKICYSVPEKYQF